jgi:hypothetical protein
MAKQQAATQNKGKPAPAPQKVQPQKNKLAPVAADEVEDDDEKPSKPAKPDGTKEEYILRDGSKMTAVWADSKLCCPTCKRKLATSAANDAVKRQRALDRKVKMAGKATEFFQHFKQLMVKNAKWAGEEPPTDEELLEMFKNAGGQG